MGRPAVAAGYSGGTRARFHQRTEKHRHSQSAGAAGTKHQPRDDRGQSQASLGHDCAGVIGLSRARAVTPRRLYDATWYAVANSILAITIHALLPRDWPALVVGVAAAA